MNKDTQSWSNSNLTEMDELVQKVQQLERENAALRADAERYRWIKRDSARVADVLEAFVAFSTCDLDREIEIARAKEDKP